MDERKEPYIEQQAAEDALYTRLQRQTLEEVQRLSGKVWTDYNAHDPGVTLADIANYALAELDYKLGFGVADSLTETGRPFDAARFGLFPPVDVYATSPVTEDDYRRMLLATVPGEPTPSASSCPPLTEATATRPSGRWRKPSTAGATCANGWARWKSSVPTSWTSRRNWR